MICSLCIFVMFVMLLILVMFCILVIFWVQGFCDGLIVDEICSVERILFEFCIEVDVWFFCVLGFSGVF